MSIQALKDAIAAYNPEADEAVREKQVDAVRAAALEDYVINEEEAPLVSEFVGRSTVRETKASVALIDALDKPSKLVLGAGAGAMVGDAGSSTGFVAKFSYKPPRTRAELGLEFYRGSGSGLDRQLQMPDGTKLSSDSYTATSAAMT